MSQAISTWSLTFTRVFMLSLTSTVTVTQSLTLALTPSVSVTDTVTGDVVGMTMAPVDEVRAVDAPVSGAPVRTVPLDDVATAATPESAPCGSM